MRPEDIKNVEQELNEEELEQAAGGVQPTEKNAPKSGVGKAGMDGVVILR